VQAEGTTAALSKMPGEQRMVLYGFGDTSGSAFGAARVKTDGDIHYQCGQWQVKVMEEESSNWQELNNVVGFVADLVKKQTFGALSCSILRTILLLKIFLEEHVKAKEVL
jgi:hypothetical protein